jgi:zinc transport system substrate-binding protein
LKKLLIFLGIVVLVLLLFVAPFIIPTSDKNGSKVLVTTSIFPLYDMTKHIAGNRADVMMLIPFGKDIHAFEPTPKDRVNLQHSRLFLFSGAHLEPWAATFEHANRIDMSHYVTLNTLADDDTTHHHHGHDEAYDPHYWLDIDNMIRLTKVIRDELSKIDPLSKEYFSDNATTYIKELEHLKKEYVKVLSTCKKDFIVVSHNAFGYLSKEYGFHVLSLNGFSADALPSAQSMKRVIDTVKQHQITTIFFEPFSSDRLMQTVANESNTSVDTLHPLANITFDEMAARKSYITIMYENLKKLSNVLECQ